jgi:polysaccharide deacetylase family protein (PEP-CTERM system associated)
MPGAPAIVNAMTVDVEDYFQVSAFESVVSRTSWDSFDRRVVRNTDRLLEILAEHGAQATFFILGWVAEREPALVRRIARQGHEVASHGHHHRLVYDQTPQEFRDDIRRAKGVVESLCGSPVVGYRAPSFSVTLRSLWALDVLIEEGFAWDASIFPIHHDRYGLPGAPRHPYRVRHSAANAAPDPSNRAEGSLLEIPGSTVRIGGLNAPIAGGGYFRILPYRWTRWGIDRVNRRDQRPVVFYLHPWEIDPDQPRLEAPRLSAFRHYRNLAGTEPRLCRLLSEFRFDTVAATFQPTAETAVPSVV